ncbi:unnamed protein product [Soboliphyme baturini]|uniref:Sec5 domain-containing protein n=1 Tax=Soboliphyme baturini TaxID=241478 RepID=A0A183IAH7_9BILA|nr:unnamed protein product [Soboliphyme baturini]
MTDLIATCVLIRIQCVTLIVDDACRSVMELGNKETWKLVAYDNESTRTALPDIFESIVNETSIVLKGDVDVAKPKLISRLEQLLCSFKDVLLLLSGISEMGAAAAAAAAAANAENKDRPTTLSLTEARDRYRRAKVKDRKLLMVLANCDYVLNKSIPRCIKRLSLCGMRFSERMHEVANLSYGWLMILSIFY